MSDTAVSPEAEGQSARAENAGDESKGNVRALGKYRIIAELGSGGMATVYLAVVRGPGGFSKLVVVKALRAHLGQDSEFLAMFMDEARLAARLHHPNVVQTNEVSTENGQYLIVMEYLDGVTLNELLERSRRRGVPVPLGMHLRIIHEAMNGLHYAHELTDFDGSRLELVHRDISPHNVFVTFDGQVKVLDFGIAKVANSTNDTRTGVIKGKVRYMSPEQIAGDSVDRRADIFAVGAMLWEAATGERLWKGKPDVEIMTRVVNGKVPAPREAAPEANETLDGICRKSLAKDPAERHPGCPELQADLEKLLDDLGDRSTSKTIGRFVCEAFEETRQQRKKVIESQLSAANGASAVESFSDPSVPSLPTYGSGSHSIDREIHVDTGSGSRKRLMEAIDAEVPGASRGRRIAVIGGLIAFGAIAAIAIPRLINGSKTAPVASAVPVASSAVVVAAAPTPSPVVKAAAADTTLTLTVRTEPSTATLFLDGAPLTSNPFKSKLERDGASHVLRAEAAGYVTKATTITSDGDHDVVITLDKTPSVSGVKIAHPLPVATVAAAPSPPPAATPAPTSEAKPAPTATGKKPPKAIDTVNPWD